MGRINYLLDTNVLSEPARKQPNSNVMQRLAQYDGQYATAAIVWHELQYGCELLVKSKRKIELQSYLLTLQDGGLIILPYDPLAAVNNLTLITRNTNDFSDFKNLELDNWFE